MSLRGYKQRIAWRPGNLRVAIVFIHAQHGEETEMNSIVYIVGLVVIVVAVLGFFGLR